ncbi:conserved hypothetical protein [Thiomonas sp. X19]|uniref:helix-turn-helix domain-containing protein n=1 Tax=Thiomonas sp. X19 TaxID=1050370 RepID=UPI000B6F227B|nr:helix-turn-helix domain-containing protein [Thiomonas sp. X19]SCC94627.1 conserved hypothetical protein [Thiomonas sp. X19]
MTSSNSQADAQRAARAQAGGMLRAAREAAGKSASELATQLKVSSDKILALEAGDWERLPDTAFARGLLRAASKALKADTEAIMQVLPPLPHAKTIPTRPTATSSGKPVPAAPAGGGHGARKLWWLAVAGLVIAALLVFFLPHAEDLAKWLPQTMPAKPASAVLAQASSSPVLPSATPSIMAKMPSANPLAIASASAAAAPAATDSGAGSRQFPQPAAASSSPVAAAAGPALSIQAAAESWVQVTSSQGTVLFSGLVAAAGQQSIALSQQDFPLQLVVGNAAQTQVSLDGKPVDLTPRTNNNVARLTIPKP